MINAKEAADLSDENISTAYASEIEKIETYIKNAVKESLRYIYHYKTGSSEVDVTVHTTLVELGYDVVYDKTNDELFTINW